MKEQQDRKGYLKLKYDTDGCGCAVNGVIALWFVPELDTMTLLLKQMIERFMQKKRKLVFLDEQMKIDFSQTTNCFQLKSPQQILNGHMSLVINRKNRLTQRDSLVF